MHIVPSSTMRPNPTSFLPSHAEHTNLDFERTSFHLATPLLILIDLHKLSSCLASTFLLVDILTFIFFPCFVFTAPYNLLSCLREALVVVPVFVPIFIEHINYHCQHGDCQYVLYNVQLPCESHELAAYPPAKKPEDKSARQRPDERGDCIFFPREPKNA